LCFLGYLVWDTFVCVFLVGDVKSSASIQNLVHHAIGILGCIGNIYVGTYVTTMSCASMLTEISTPFINLRWFLSAHKNTGGTLYFINGLTFTSLFFIFRNVFQTWMLSTLFFPAVLRDDFGRSSNIPRQILLWMLIFMYIMLTFLNFYWFSRMARGVHKAITGGGKKAKKE